jgi:uncharacterized protein
VTPRPGIGEGVVRRHSAPSLQVPLERLQRRDPVRDWTVTVTAAELIEPGISLRVADVSVDPGTAVGVDVVLDQVTEGVMVVGTVTCTWSGDCARCVRPVDGVATAEVGELFETAPQEGESYLLDTEYVDLVPMVRDAVLLELPIGAVACPNPDPCPHAPPELASDADDPDGPDDDSGEGAGTQREGLADERWAALDALVFDDEERAGDEEPPR